MFLRAIGLVKGAQDAYKDAADVLKKGVSGFECVSSQ